MTAEEKRELLREYCKRNNCSSGLCVLCGDWKRNHITIVGCLDIDLADEKELDEALRLIKSEASDAVAALVEAQIKELKSAEVVIQLEVGDGSALRVAHAICKESVQTLNGKENALIYLDELTEHIDAYVRAERKALEYKKLTEEG